jgi:iron complex transport system permease protein
VTAAATSTGVAQREHGRLAALALGAAVVLLFLGSLAVGRSGLGLLALLQRAAGEDAETVALILREIRLPRAILGVLVGMALGLAGAALQGLLRNPLAEPGLIGASGAAALGAVAALYFGLSSLFALALPLGGLLGAATAALAVMLLAGERSGPLTLILAGVAISSLAGALTTLALNLSPNPFASVEMLFWLLGSVTDRSLVHVWLATPFILAGGLLLMTTGRALDALTLGEEAAQNLGVNLVSLRNRVVAGTALAVGAGTAVAGTIGFVGLVVPHLLRPLVGHEPRRLLPASMLGGAALVLLADVTLRIFAPLSEVRLGVVTALIGAPFFLWLVIKTRRELGP